MLRSRENEGIDFWWLDWQQGEGFVKIPLANPTILLNYVFFTDPEHWNNTVRELQMIAEQILMHEVEKVKLVVDVSSHT